MRYCLIYLSATADYATALVKLHVGCCCCNKCPLLSEQTEELWLPVAKKETDGRCRLCSLIRKKVSAAIVYAMILHISYVGKL